jgi:hypothetical protein
MTAKHKFHYIPLLRPASFSTLPQGIRWDFVESPGMAGLANRSDLPRSTHRYGVIEINRQLTAEELKQFDLRSA